MTAHEQINCAIGRKMNFIEKVRQHIGSQTADCLLRHLIYTTNAESAHVTRSVLVRTDSQGLQITRVGSLVSCWCTFRPDPRLYCCDDVIVRVATTKSTQSTWHDFSKRRYISNLEEPSFPTMCDLSMLLTGCILYN